ncbi:MAG: hypothetical protein H3C34_06765, partial [Caldilineaceae bacterium]|nr:hypothetical protein [Caldilineaceae bacterium]
MVMLLLAALGGSQLHEWARQRIVQLSVLAEIDQTPVAAATQVAAPAADALAEQPAPAEAAAEVAAPAEIVKPINILLLGTDERPDEFGPTRTDTIIVLSI